MLFKWFHIVNAKAAIRRLNILVETDNAVLENPEEVVMLVECLFPVRHQNNISELLLEVLERSNGDLSIAKKIIQVLILLLKSEEKQVGDLESDNSCALAISRLGKQELLTRVFELHKADEDVRDQEREIRKALTLASVRVSLNEINKVKRAVDLGITTEVYQKAQSFTIAPIHSKDNQVIGGISDISLVITHMQKHLKRSDILNAGLQVVAQYIESAKENILFDPFFSEAFIMIMNTALMSEQSTRSHQQLAITILLALTSKEQFCRVFVEHDGCELILKVLRNESPQGLAEELHQIGLWTISNLCEEDCSRIKLEESGLKVYLHQLIFEKSEDDEERLCSTGRSSSSKAVIPLRLRLLYKDDDLREAKRFHIPTIEPVSAKNENTMFHSQADILPRSKRRLYPAHGTAQDLFQQGDPGLL